MDPVNSSVLRSILFSGDPLFGGGIDDIPPLSSLDNLARHSLGWTSRF